MTVHHISVGGQALCRPKSFTANVNAADCRQCNRQLDKLLDVLLKAVVTGSERDRAAAVRYAGKLGFIPKEVYDVE